MALGVGNKRREKRCRVERRILLRFSCGKKLVKNEDEI
jgi:hypothetical protein